MSDSIRKLLAENEFFSGLEGPFLDFLTSHAREREIAQNELLFRQQDAAQTFYLVCRGLVALEIPAIAGPSLPIQRVREGKILGWSWLIPPYRWTFNARAEEDSLVLEFDGAAVLEHCEADHDFGYQLFKRFSQLMSERLDAARRRMMDEWNPPGFA